MLRCVDPSLSTIANTGQITRKVHMVTDDGEIQGTVDLNTAMERLRMSSPTSLSTPLMCSWMRTPHHNQRKPGCAYCPQAKEVPSICANEYVSH